MGQKRLVLHGLPADVSINGAGLTGTGIPELRISSHLFPELPSGAVIPTIDFAGTEVLVAAAFNSSQDLKQLSDESLRQLLEDVRTEIYDRDHRPKMGGTKSRGSGFI